MHPASIKNTVETSLAGQSQVSKGAMVLLVSLHLLTRMKWFEDLLTVETGVIGPPQMHIWTLATGGFVEKNLILLVLDLVVLAFTGGMFEPLWGTFEYAKFMVLVNVATCLGTALTYIMLYAIRQDLDYLFPENGGFSGFWGVLAGYLVAFKQAYPQRRLTVGGLGLTIESRLGPLLFCTGLGGVYFLHLLPGSAVLMGCNGAMASWIYLRYYQLKDGQKGDPSESFTFTDFFPSKLQPVVTILADRVFKLAVVLRMCPKKPLQYDLSAPSSIKIALPGASKSDAERRRQIALRDLESRTRPQESQAKNAVNQDVVPSTPVAKDKSEGSGGAPESHVSVEGEPTDI